ncbi:hypothetical protein OG203_30935 [Nocardia sp. NBC_01499]|uniref:MarR family transcriptional regulator n=1 Tax=Nocardia sp. NBC_01499 TaxID=2903597 RepID=UPI00386A0057
MSTTETTPVKTDSEKALWSALESSPDRTAAELADIAAISGSTARKILARWSVDGLVKRIHRSDPRSADRWNIFLGTDPEPTTTTTTSEPDYDTTADADSATPDTAAADSDDSATTTSEPATVEETPSQPTAEPTTDTESDGAAVESENASTDKPEKLAPGALRGQVEDHLRDHPNDEFSPHQIGKELERSSGAVHNALVKLTASGIATQTSDTPKKFRLAPA